MEVKHQMTLPKARKFLDSEEYAQLENKGFVLNFKKPISTSKRGRSITRFDFCDHTMQSKYNYCRVFVRLKDGTLLEYKRLNKITDASLGKETFEEILDLLKNRYEAAWLWNCGFTDIT